MTRLRVIAALTVLVVMFAGGVALWALASTQEDVTTNTEAIARADAAARDAKRAIVQIEREGRERRDQTCTVFERQHRSDVRQLRRTYRYLRTVLPQERGTSLTRTIIRGLPQQEREAKRDNAPSFCDLPGVKAERLWREGKRNGVLPSERQGAPPIGLREPDPRIPKRPRQLSQ
jgi:hypothetical protein